VGLTAAQRDQAEAQLSLLLAGAREEQIQQAEVGVAQAQTALEQAGVRVTQAEAAVSQAAANVTKAQADVTAAENALERMTLRAPFDGRVGRVDGEIGELVAPSVPIVQLADFGGWLVRTTDLTELDVVAVKRGSPAEVTIDALPGEVIPGTVLDIGAVSQLVRGDVTYEVTIALDESALSLPLRWGMTAFAEIEAE
jgi:multidrug resistance efflux pump